MTLLLAFCQPKLIRNQKAFLLGREKNPKSMDKPKVAIPRNWNRWFKSWVAKTTLVMDLVMVIQTIVILVFAEYPSIRAWGYEIIENYTGYVLFVVWPSAYIVLDLGMLVAVPFENIGLPGPMVFFYRSFMFIHYVYAAVIFITGSMSETAIQTYTLAHIYTVDYIILSILCLCILVLMLAEDEL